MAAVKLSAAQLKALEWYATKKGIYSLRVDTANYLLKHHLIGDPPGWTDGWAGYMRLVITPAGLDALAKVRAALAAKGGS